MLTAHRSQSLTFDRFIRALRRYWWIVIGLFVIGWFVGSAVWPGSYTSVTILRLRDSPGVTLASAVQGIETRVPRRSNSELIAYLSEDSREAAIIGERDVTFHIGIDPGSSGLSITASGDDRATADAVVADAVAEIRSVRQTEATDAVQSATKALSDQEAVLNDRLDELDRQLAETGANEIQANVLALDRLDVVNQLAGMKTGKSLLASYTAEADGVDLISNTPASTRRSLFGSATSGFAILGGLVGLLIVAALAKRSTVVNSRSDLVEIAEGVPYFGEVTGTRPPLALASLMHRLASQSGLPVMVVEPQGFTNKSAIAALRAALEQTRVAETTTELLLPPPVEESPEALTQSMNAAAVFVVVEAGRTSASELRSITQNFTDSGRPIDGVILAKE